MYQVQSLTCFTANEDVQPISKHGPRLLRNQQMTHTCLNENVGYLLYLA